MYIKRFIRIKHIVNVPFSLWSKTQIHTVVKCHLKILCLFLQLLSSLSISVGGLLSS